MKPSIFILLTTCLLVFFNPSLSFAQSEALVLTSTTLDQKAKASSSKMYLKGDLMVTETGEDKNQSTVLFDATKETLYIINHKKKEYIEMTRQDLEALSAMLQQQLAAMEQQLAMLPESQQKMIREQMGAAFGGHEKPAEYSLEESGVKVKKWEADKYVGMAEGKKQSEVYIASYNEIGKDTEDFEVLNKFFDLIKNHMQGMSKSFSNAGIGFFSESMPGFKEGMPVKTIMYNSKGEVISTSTVDDISEETVAETIFQIPENYKKKKMDQLAKQ